MKGTNFAPWTTYKTAFSILNGSIINEGALTAVSLAAVSAFQYPQRIDNQ